jgi:hypothetical protein
MGNLIIQVNGGTININGVSAKGETSTASWVEVCGVSYKITVNDERDLYINDRIVLDKDEKGFKVKNINLQRISSHGNKSTIVWGNVQISIDPENIKVKKGLFGLFKTVEYPTALFQTNQK